MIFIQVEPKPEKELLTCGGVMVTLDPTPMVHFALTLTRIFCSHLKQFFSFIMISYK